jgi:ferredoxin
MSGRRGQGFGRRRGAGSGKGQNVTMVRDIFGWIKSQIQYKNSPDRTVAYRPPTESLGQVDELSSLRHQAESIQSQLNKINARIHQIDKAPSSLSAHVTDTVCTGCGRCVSICPQRAIAMTNNIARIDRDKCTGCGICVSECPFGAIDLIELNTEYGSDFNQ